MPKRRFNSIANSSNSSLSSLDLTIKDSSNSYDFSNIRNKPISEIIKKIPETAVKRALTPTKKIAAGFEYKWNDNYYTWRVRFHCPDVTVEPGKNASQGWIVRIQCGKHYMDSSGNFQPPGIYRENSPSFNESICNDTHIPVINDL